MQNIWIFYQDGGTPKQGWGDRHYFLAKYYDKKKYKVTIFSANECHMYSEPVQFTGNYWLTDYNGLSYCWIKVNHYKKSNSVKRIIAWVQFTFKLFFLLRLKIGKPDIIIVSSMPMFPILPAFYYKFFYRTKVIFEVRDIWPLTILQMGDYSRINPFVLIMRLIEKLAYRYSDYLVSVLDKAYLHFEDSVKFNFRFQWISNGIDEVVILYSNDSVHLLPSNKFIVGYAGKMNVSNAVEFIVEAARHLTEYDNIHFVFIGDGDERDQLVEYSKKLNNVTFIPKVKKHELHGLIKCFNVAIISFRNLDIYKYGISTNKLFDYLVAGVPIVMASSHDHSAFTESRAIFMAESENPLAISKAILQIYELPEGSINEIKSLTPEFALKNFTYRQLSKRYETIFNDLVDSKM